MSSRPIPQARTPQGNPLDSKNHSSSRVGLPEETILNGHGVCTNPKKCFGRIERQSSGISQGFTIYSPREPRPDDAAKAGRIVVVNPEGAEVGNCLDVGYGFGTR